MNYKTLLVGLSLLLGTCYQLLAQTNTKSYKLEDGVYAKHQDLKNNQPSYPLYRIPNFDYQLDQEQNLLFLSTAAIETLPSSEIASLDNIWGLCIQGVPYMKVQPQGKEGAIYFVRYHLLGRLCYLYYPSLEDKPVEMYIYNPFTGTKVGSKTIMNKERTLIKKLMLFETGELLPYSVESVKNAIKDDLRLLKTLEALSEQEAEGRLFKTIKIYNDRHPIFKAS